jgi:TRAP-type uncharacterized transport system fused permease subunit
MADFMGVSYFDVIARGYMPALIYYAGIAVAVYLLASRYIRRPSLEGLGLSGVTVYDNARVLAFFIGIGILIAIMGIMHIAPMYSAIIAAAYLLLTSMAINYWETRSTKNVGQNIVLSLDHFATFVADLTLLLATLGIMTGLLTVTGLPTKVGFALMDVSHGSIVLLLLISFFFGYLVGLGLPPAATFIITAIIIVPYMIDAGINPWLGYFYSFFIGVFSELSPPTSVTAAVASKIAEASFMKTMSYAMMVCVPLFVLMPGIFLYPNTVVNPGLSQLVDGAILAIVSTALATSFWTPAKNSKLLLLRVTTGFLGFLLLAAPILKIPYSGIIGIAILGLLVSGLTIRKGVKVLESM